MAPLSYKVVGLLSLLYSMSAVVAKPVDLQRASSLTSPTFIPKSGAAASLVATPAPSRGPNNDAPAHGSDDGRKLTSVQRPNSTQLSATKGSDSHRSLIRPAWSWRHPKHSGSSPISSPAAPVAPSASDQNIEEPSSGNHLKVRGGPPSPGKTMLDPHDVVANNQRVQANRHRKDQRKREVLTNRPPSSSSVASAVASVAPVVHSGVSLAVSNGAPVSAVSTVASSAAPVSAVSTAASGASTLKGSISSTASASSSASSSLASATAKKRGILYNSASSANVFIGKPMVSWALNWYSEPQSFSATGVEFSPSLWAPKTLFLISWQNDAKVAIAAGAKAILGFYEPDQEKGANLNAADAATAYKQNITDLFGGSAKLGSVGVSNGAGSNQGLAYLSQFMSACSACKIDFINIHWSDTYDSGTVQRFKDYVDSAWTKFQKPIWVGEFGFKSPPFPTEDQEVEFLKAVLPWLDQHQHVDRYAYYMASNMTTGGTLNSVGTTYATFTGNATG